MKKKKGFTLIELLAVIIILGIIALIAIPKVTDVIKDSKKGAIIVSADGLVDAVESKCQTNKLTGNEHISSYTIENGESSSELPLQNMPNRAYASVDDKCKATVTVYDGNFMVTGTKGHMEVVESSFEQLPSNPESCFIFNSETHTIEGYNDTNSNCTSEVKIPATIDGVPVEYIGNLAFVNYSHADGDYDTVKYTAYRDGDKLVSTDTKENLYSAGYTDLDFIYPTYYNNSTALKNTFTPKSVTKLDLSQATNLKKIGSMAFYQTGLTQITFGNNTNLKSIGYQTFKDTNIEILNLASTGIEYIGQGAFNSYNSSRKLKNVYFSNALKYIGYDAFGFCKLTSLTLPASVEEIGTSSFAEMYTLKNIDLSQTKLTIIPTHAFENSSVENLKLPDTLIEISSHAFNGNVLLNVVIPNNVEIIGNYAFQHKMNSSFSSLVLGNKIREIGKNAFSAYNASNTNVIDNLIIPDSVQQLGEYAFMYQKINNLTIGSGLKVISNSAFENSFVHSLILNEGLEEIQNQAFYDSNAWKTGNDFADLVIPNSVKTIGNSAFGYKMNGNITIGSGITSIASGAFLCYSYKDENPDMNEACKYTITINKPQNSSIYNPDTRYTKATINWVG